jgi:hypothetical protein
MYVRERERWSWKVTASYMANVPDRAFYVTFAVAAKQCYMVTKKSKKIKPRTLNAQNCNALCHNKNKAREKQV